MSEKLNYPDFHQPFEKQPPLEAKEQMAATRLFNDTFDDYTLKYMDRVKRYDFDSAEMRPTARFSLSILSEGQEYTVTFTDYGIAESKASAGYRDSEDISRQLTVQRIENRRGRELWNYNLGIDDVVRRFDIGDVTNQLQIERALDKRSIPIPSFILPEYYPRDSGRGADTRKLIQDIKEDLEYQTEVVEPNRRLEEDMGVNNQPVSLAEIRGLREFLDTAKVLPK